MRNSAGFPIGVGRLVAHLSWPFLNNLNDLAFVVNILKNVTTKKIVRQYSKIDYLR